MRQGDSALELRLLGSPEFRNSGHQGLHSLLGQPKALGVLAYVALAPAPGYRRRDGAVALFWPDQDQAHARGALRRTLYVLRDALGSEAIVGRGIEDIALAPDLVTTDVSVFQRACDEGRWQDAMASYRGDLLEGFFLPRASPEFDQWLDQERQRLRQRAAWAAEQLSASELAAGRVPAAADHAWRAVALLPDDEPQLRRLLRLLAELGDGAGANRAYQRFADRLAAEYGATPAPETQALIATIRSRTVPRERSSVELWRPVVHRALPTELGEALPATAPGRQLRERWQPVAWLVAGLLIATAAFTLVRA